MKVKRYQYFILLILFASISHLGNAQYWLRNSSSLSELWINNLDLDDVQFHNKQQWVSAGLEKLKKDSSLISYYLINEVEPQYLKKRKTPFYQYLGNFYYEKGEKYKLFVNPILNLSYGKEGSNTLYQNTRGVEFKGNIGGKKGVGFYSMITENQWQAPSLLDSFRSRYKVVPGQIWYKGFKGSAYDFIGARAYITFSPIKNFVTAQFGNDKNFIGFGERSLILSDHAAPYLFLKLNTKFGKHIRYQNIFSKYTNYSPLLGNSLFIPKYGATHRVSALLGKKTLIGLSEMVVFQRNDTNQRGYDLSYLNPVIFLRAAEIDAGSNDNVMMALDAKHHLTDNILLYGQFLLDEFNIKFIRQRNNWWGNKYGYQIGAKWVNKVEMENKWSVSTEYNRVRPYTYSHFNTSSNYSHFNQSLAHPLGSNFHELYTRVNFVPHIKLFRKQDALIFDLNISASRKGVDSLGGNNYGGNILLDNQTRVDDFGNTLFQGKSVNALISNFAISYRLGPASFFDIRIHSRIGDSHIGNGPSISLGYRLNANMRQYSWY